MSSSFRSPSTRTRAHGATTSPAILRLLFRLGSPDEFRHLVDALHQAGIGVIIDWVPGHFATDPWALPRFDGTALYEHEDPRLGWHPDWGSYIFNFGRNEVKSFLLCNSYYWLHEFHIDGLRIDAVASMLYLDYSRKAGEWVPNKYGGNDNLEAVALLQQVNSHNYRREPGTMMIVHGHRVRPAPGVQRAACRLGGSRQLGHCGVQRLSRISTPSIGSIRPRTVWTRTAWRASSAGAPAGRHRRMGRLERGARTACPGLAGRLHDRRARRLDSERSRAAASRSAVCGSHLTCADDLVEAADQQYVHRAFGGVRPALWRRGGARARARRTDPVQRPRRRLVHSMERGERPPTRLAHVSERRRRRDQQNPRPLPCRELRTSSHALT